MSSVRTILASLFTALGGFFLLALTAGVGFAIYLGTAPDGFSAQADAVAMPPTATTAPVASAMTTRTASVSLTKPLATPTRSTDPSARVHQLQKALARAGCYEGRINGNWSDASKDAMRGFVQTVNAKLPVDNPDETLVALIESNEAAKCTEERAISTGALGASLQPAAQQALAASVSAKQTTLASGEARDQGDEPTLLTKVWAPAKMLVPTKPADEQRLAINDREMTASNDPPANSASTVPGSASTLHFESGEPLATVQPVDPSPPAARPLSEASPDPKAKSKKTKTAKRRPAKDDDVETTISKGFDTLQRSISSMF